MEERSSIIKLENYGKDDLMKRYFRWDDDIVGTMYIEVDNGYATKQIAVTSNKYIASNRKDETHHFYLTEGIIDVNNMIEFGGSEINEKQFYCIWNLLIIGT